MEYWKIDKELIEHVCKIARLALSNEEKEKFVKELEDILSAFRKIDEVDTSDTRPSFHPLEFKNVMREDEPKVWKWQPLANARHKEKNYFKGPRIV